MTIRSWCNPRPGWTETAQRERLTGELYVADKKDRGAKQRAAMIRSIRPGDIVEVCEGYLVALDLGNALKQRNDWLRTMDAIEDRGGVVLELCSGRRSVTPADQRLIQAHAFNRLGRAGQGRKSAANGKGSKGAPIKWTLTPEQSRVIESIVNDRRLKNDDQRTAKIHSVLGLKINRSWWRRHFRRDPHAAYAG